MKCSFLNSEKKNGKKTSKTEFKSDPVTMLDELMTTAKTMDPNLKMDSNKSLKKPLKEPKKLGESPSNDSDKHKFVEAWTNFDVRDIQVIPIQINLQQQIKIAAASACRKDEGSATELHPEMKVSMMLPETKNKWLFWF